MQNLKKLLEKLLEKDCEICLKDKAKLVELITTAYLNGVYFYRILGLIRVIILKETLPKNYFKHLFEPNGKYPLPKKKQEDWRYNPKDNWKTRDEVVEEIKKTYIRIPKLKNGDSVILIKKWRELTYYIVILIQNNIKPEEIIKCTIS